MFDRGVSSAAHEVVVVDHEGDDDAHHSAHAEKKHQGQRRVPGTKKRTRRPTSSPPIRPKLRRRVCAWDFPFDGWSPPGRSRPGVADWACRQTRDLAAEATPRGPSAPESRHRCVPHRLRSGVVRVDGLVRRVDHGPSFRTQRDSKASRDRTPRRRWSRSASPPAARPQIALVSRTGMIATGMASGP